VKHAKKSDMKIKADKKKFKPHMMFPKGGGKPKFAKTYEDHIRLGKQGYGHTKPKK
jgi:hypothetical protein|tara:strand:- start:2219 stop:2386 length:168 start_codon:yes stop_codon:yes gene_type:complete